MTEFRYVEFYDVPRCLAIRHGDKLFLLQSAFDEELEEYPNCYSVYVLPEEVDSTLHAGSWEFLETAPITRIGTIEINQVKFDPTKRKELDASVLDSFLKD
jgi:hypothetical protein